MLTADIVSLRANHRMRGKKEIGARSLRDTILASKAAGGVAKVRDWFMQGEAGMEVEVLPKR